LRWGILHFLNNIRALWFAIGIWERGVPGVCEWCLDVSLYTDFRWRTRPVIIAQGGLLHLPPQNNMKTEQPKRSCHFFTVSFTLICIETSICKPRSSHASVSQLLRSHQLISSFLITTISSVHHLFISISRNKPYYSSPRPST
jgi:hypothetical protein